MNRHALIALCSALAVPRLLAVPTEIARESFEGTAGAIGFTTSVPQFIETSVNPLSDFFSVLPNNGTKISGNRTLPGADGANIFAAEDCDTDRTAPATKGPQEVSLTTNAVNIAGKTNTQVRLLMAAPGRHDPPAAVNLTEYENFSNAPTFINKLLVEASIDNGPFQRVVQFSPTVIDVNTTLSYDSDGNNIGNDPNPIPTNPTTLDATLREGIYSIPTGSNVRIKLTFETDATGELICFDNIRIFGESSTTAAPVLGGVPAAALVFTEGGAAAAIAPAITVTDTDSANLTSASVTISQNYVNGQDVLTATPSGTIVAGDIVFNAATGILTITRNATKAAYQAVLRSVSYRNTNTSAPSIATRRVTFQTTDGTNPSNSPTRDISVVDAIVTQSLPFVESWETDGQGTRYSVEGGFSSPPDRFARFQPTGLVNIDGTFAWGVENVDNNADFTELITFNLNPSGLVNLTGDLRVAAGGGAVYDTGDFLRVEASADGGAFQNVLAFHSESGGAALMRQDNTPADATNVGDGTVLTAALQNFTFALPAASTTLTVRIRAFTNITGENITFDRLAVSGVLPPIIVTTANDTGGGSLRAAVAAALTQPGASTIIFDPAVFNGEAADVITLSSGEILLDDAGGVVIDASGIAAGVAIDGGAGTNRLFRVTGPTAVTMQRLQLSGGNGAGGGAPANYGGAIHSAGNLTLTDCSISSCSAFAGGAIYNTTSTQTLTLNRCTLSQNAASYGGAIQNEGILVATNTTFALNTASQEGGAISSPFGKPASLTHCTVANNQSTGPGGGGGGIGIGFSLTNSIVAGNTPDNINGTPVLSGTNLVTGDPRLAPLTNSGGHTRTLPPLPGSPARDRITVTAVTTDQRGTSRPQWGAADIGAVEAGIQADCAWEARDVFTPPQTALANLANVDLMLANTAATQITGIVPVINFNDLNGAPSGGFFGGDSLFLCDNLTPRGLLDQDDNNFATQARAYLTITTAGDYTFGFSSDDGARLRLYSTNGGANPVFTSSTRLNATNPANPAHNGNALTFDAPTGNSDTLGVANLTPGVYGVEFTMWEDGGGAGGEVFFATGAKTAVDGTFALLGGNNLTRTPGVSRPVNDDFASALPLSGLVVRTASCNAGATIEAGEPTSIPGQVPLRGKSVWWTWTAPVTGSVQIDTIGSSFDTTLAVLTGSTVGGLTQTAFNDDLSTSSTASRVIFGATAGTAYRIQVSGYDSLEGTMQLNIVLTDSFIVTTPNDSGLGSLRQTLANASTSTGANTVTFAPSLAGPIVLASEIVITDPAGVTIDASGVPSGVTISGNQTSRIFSVNSGSTALLKSLTLTGGNGLGAARTGEGGAILNLGTLTIERCTLSGNTAGTTPGNPELGGAIYSHTGAGLTLRHCTLSGNQCVSNRGGAIASRGTLALVHCTISGNTGRFDSGGVRSDGPTTLTDTIIAGNILTSGPPNDLYIGTTTLTRVGANIVPLFGNDGGATLSGPPRLTTDPLLAPLANYGGPTETMALKPGSPARNAATGTPAPTADQRNFPIVGQHDIGAYEAGNALSTNFDAYIWETLPATANKPQHAASFDFDGDGQTNYDEYITGTNAADPTSAFRLSLLEDGGDLKIIFPSITGRTYRLEQSSTLLSNSWVDSGLPPRSGNNALQNFIVTPATGPARRFYRIVVSQP